MSNLNITAETHYQLKLVYKDAEGFPVDLSGASARLVIRPSMYQDAVINKSAVITAATGEIEFTVNPEETKELLDNVNSETFIYGIQLVLADGTTRLISSGDAVINQNVARGA